MRFLLKVFCYNIEIYDIITIYKLRGENIMITLLNPASLLLGLIAWILPIINIINHKKLNNKNWATLSVTSMSACAISIYFQILYNNHLVNINDWTAIMDTIGSSVFLSSALLVVTIILNIITLLMYRNKTTN